MDPLSVTSGIVGIVAFALKLAKTASQMKRAIEELKSAPKEAQDLIERLVILETTCQLIGSHLERRETLPGHSSSVSPDIISKALVQCLVRIRSLQQAVSTSSPGDSAVGTPRLKFDTASRLRLVLRKDKIITLIQEIDRVVSHLQFVIQVDLWTMTAIPLQSPSPCCTKTPPMDESQSHSKTMLVNVSSLRSTVTRDIRQSTQQQCRTFRYFGYITWTIADDRTMDNEDKENQITHRKGSFSFQLPFTSMQLSMQYFCGMGTPSYALNVTHIVQSTSELGWRLRDLMTPGNDPRKLHELISRRQLSLYSIYRWNDRELNLFFLAISARWVEGCKYLLQHDFRHEFEQGETPPSIFGTINGVNGDACEITETVLSLRPHDMREEDMRFLLDTGSHPRYFNQYLKVFLESPSIDHSSFLSHAWTYVIKNILIGWSGPYDPHWTPALRYIIEQGVDLHQRFSACYASAYLLFLGATTHPFEADAKAISWLEMLKACGVDLSSYVKFETTLVRKFQFGGSKAAKKRKLVFLDFEGLPIPSWRWEMVTESSIVDVLREFHNLGSDFVEYQLHSPNPSGPEDFKHWRVGEHYESWGKYCFPFLHAPIDCIREPSDARLDDVWCRETYNRAVKIRDSRLARREAKKRRKAHLGEKPPSIKMPGTWVD